MEDCEEYNEIEEDIYSEEMQEELLEEDEISPEEQGFMKGYIEES